MSHTRSFWARSGKRSLGANSADQLTPEYITQLLQLPEVSADGIYFLRFEKNRIRLEIQT